MDHHVGLVRVWMALPTEVWQSLQGAPVPSLLGLSLLQLHTPEPWLVTYPVGTWAAGL